MKRLTNKQLRIVRNIISIVGIVIGILIWRYIPDTFRNSSFFHVGNGEYGSKYGVLIILLIQLFAFIPYDNSIEEIHTMDPEYRAELEEKRTRRILEIQIIKAVSMALVIWCVMGFAVLLL